jgi:hypothetical protein
MFYGDQRIRRANATRQGVVFSRAVQAVRRALPDLIILDSELAGAIVSEAVAVGAARRSCCAAIRHHKINPPQPPRLGRTYQAVQRAVRCRT